MLGIGLAVAAAIGLSGCTAVPAAPSAVGQDYPGTCMPPELSWPTDFLESLPGESDGVAGSIVGLRLEYSDSRWVWRLRSADTRHDLFGEPQNDSSAGRESIVDVRTLEKLASHEVELTDAEQHSSGTGILDAALRSGEEWPSPLIIEMARAMDDGEPAWRITMCDTATNEFSEHLVH
ncbi:hypothetical protein GCM10009775_06660 [Microbacterium aoyamense]|uniref:Uncharacterized protein n=2 Tax=Microbacterium aoyamense TaxID=344166 RepID=A0ABN2PB33_9MICO